MPRAATKKTAASPQGVAPEDTSVAPVLNDEPATRPNSFSALNKQELIAAALAFGTDDESSEEVMRADLEANGIKWNDYVVHFRLPGWEDLVTAQRQEEAGLIEPPIVEEPKTVTTETVKEVTVVTKPPGLELSPDNKYLIKFVGENWYFERAGHRFSQKNPYALMDAVTAQNALVEEPTKFRQAFPDELQEFYA